MARCGHVSYVDDGAFPGTARCDNVLREIPAAAAIIHETISAFMFDTNMVIGKTECILRLVGPGAEAVKLELKPMKHLIKFTANTGDYYLRVVEAYKYLGRKLVANCSNAAEITQRKVSCVSVMGPIASKCFDHDGVPVEKQITISRSLMFSRLLYAAGSWHEQASTERRQFSKAVMHVWRRTTQSTYHHIVDRHQEPMNGQQVIVKHGLMAPATMLRLLRLNLFVRIAVGKMLLQRR